MRLSPEGALRPDWKVLLDPFQSLFTRPGYRYFCAFVLVFARLDRRLWVTQVILSGLVGRHFTGFYRFLRQGAWSAEAVSQRIWTLCAARCLWDGRIVAALDDTVCAKWGRHFAGLGWHHDPMSLRVKGLSHGHCFVCLAALGWQGPAQGAGHAVALFVACALYLQRKTCQAGQAFATKLELAAGLLSRLPPPPGVAALVVADGAYAKRPFVQAARAAGWHVLSRLRSDAVFYDPPPARQPGQKGRPRKYGDKHKAADWAAQEAGWQSVTLPLYGAAATVRFRTRIVLLRRLGVQARLVAVRWSQRPPVFLFSTDAALTAPQVVRAYCARFAIETGFRDAKQGFGLSTYQVRSRAGIERIVHLCLWAQTLLRLRGWGQKPQPVYGGWRKPLEYLTLGQQKQLAQEQGFFDTSAGNAAASQNARRGGRAA